LQLLLEVLHLGALLGQLRLRLVDAAFLLPQNRLGMICDCLDLITRSRGV
jgi:hypothetical protein